MQWWNDFIDWSSSGTGWRLISGAAIPFIAIIVAGIIGAFIGRGATKRVVSLQEREARNSSVVALVSVARKAATWGSLGYDERSYTDHLAEDADIRLRLLPVNGSSLAADWAQHEIAEFKRRSSTFSFQSDQALADFRERLLDWQARPSRAKRLFKSDLERWQFDSPAPEADTVKRQQDWEAKQKETPDPVYTAPTTPSGATDEPAGTSTLRPALPLQQAEGSEGTAVQVGAGAPSSATPAARIAPAWQARIASVSSSEQSAPAATAVMESERAVAEETETADTASSPIVTGIETTEAATDAESQVSTDEPEAAEAAPAADATAIDDTSAEPAPAQDAPEQTAEASSAAADDATANEPARPVSANEIRKQAADDDDD